MAESRGRAECDRAIACLERQGGVRGARSDQPVLRVSMACVQTTATRQDKLPVEVLGFPAPGGETLDALFGGIATCAGVAPSGIALRFDTGLLMPRTLRCDLQNKDQFRWVYRLLCCATLRCPATHVSASCQVHAASAGIMKRIANAQQLQQHALLALNHVLSDKVASKLVQHCTARDCEAFRCVMRADRESRIRVASSLA